MQRDASGGVLSEDNTILFLEKVYLALSSAGSGLSAEAPQGTGPCVEGRELLRG